MLSRIKHLSLLVFARRNLRQSTVRACQTIPKEIDSSKTDNVSDPDMFVSDMENPFERKKHNPRLLSQFVSPYTGFVYDKHITGLCEAQQKRLVIAVKRSRDSGFMCVQIKHPKHLRDPKLFDPFSPSRPNKY